MTHYETRRLILHLERARRAYLTMQSDHSVQGEHRILVEEAEKDCASLIKELRATLPQPPQPRE